MKKILKPAALLALLFAAWTLAQGQEVPKTAKNGFQIYNDVSIPRPDKPTAVTEADFRLTDKYLDLYPEGIPEADPET